MLDAAGWVVNSDGVREKNGQQLSFELTFYASRAELKPLATVIQSQLKPLGFRISLEETPDVNTAIAENDFGALMYSYTVAPYGDIGRGIMQLYVPSASNNERYSNTTVNELYEEYIETTDDSRYAKLEELQRVLAEDVPVVYLVNPYQLMAMSPAVEGYEPHFLENYKIDANLGLE